MSTRAAGTGPAGGRTPEGFYSSSRAERAIFVAAVAIASIGLGYLFFTQLWWKVPPDFNCNGDFTGGGLCQWVNREASHAGEERLLLRSSITTERPGPELGVPVGWAAQINGAILEGVVIPNLRWFGWLIFGTEAFIFLSLCLGFLSRLGALAAVGMSSQLVIGLAGTPGEWEWSYLLILLLAIAMFGIAPGRYFGLDRLLRPRFKALRDRGSPIGRVLLALT